MERESGLKQKAIAVTGPTASGKTALAIALAQKFGGEIISCDSMQVYRGMDIGTAKATSAEQAAVPHHLIDIIEPTERFSAADYAVLAERAADDMKKRGVLPVFCGGTGLYLEAVRTARHGEEMRSDPDFRAEMAALAEREGKEAVYRRLCAVDAESAALIHPNNLTRVIRALEIYHVTGQKKSVLDSAASRENPKLSLLTLTLAFRDRALLYDRIDRRVDAMMKEGVLEETRRLYDEGKLLPGTTAAAAIGYKECLGAVRGEMTEDEAAACLKNATHHYAKRQETWFSAKPHVTLYADENGVVRPFEDILEEASEHVERFLDKNDTEY